MIVLYIHFQSQRESSHGCLCRSTIINAFVVPLNSFVREKHFWPHTCMTWESPKFNNYRYASVVFGICIECVIYMCSLLVDLQSFWLYKIKFQPGLYQLSSSSGISWKDRHPRGRSVFKFLISLTLGWYIIQSKFPSSLFNNL